MSKALASTLYQCYISDANEIDVYVRQNVYTVEICAKKIVYTYPQTIIPKHCTSAGYRSSMDMLPASFLRLMDTLVVLDAKSGSSIINTFSVVTDIAFSSKGRVDKDLEYFVPPGDSISTNQELKFRRENKY